MEILPFEEVEHVAGAKVQLQQGGVTGIQQHVSGAVNYPYMGKRLKTHLFQ